MKISTKGRYALRLMLDLATYDVGKPVSLKDIARRQDISEKYLEQIIAVLNKGGLVRSVRGAGGGYRINRAPADISVGDILRLTEGDLAPVECVGGNSAACDRSGMCVTIRVWQKLDEAINSVVDSISVADLMAWNAEQADSYSI